VQRSEQKFARLPVRGSDGVIDCLLGLFGDLESYWLPGAPNPGCGLNPFPAAWRRPAKRRLAIHLRWQLRAHSTCLTPASFDAGFDAAAGGDGGRGDGRGDDDRRRERERSPVTRQCSTEISGDPRPESGKVCLPACRQDRLPKGGAYPYMKRSSHRRKNRWRLGPKSVEGGFEAWPSLEEIFPINFQGVNHNRGLEGGIININQYISM
jgi:hypothetical protein